MTAEARGAKIDPGGLVISRQSLPGRTLLEIEPIPIEETETLGTILRVASILQWFKASEGIAHMAWHFEYSKERDTKLKATSIIIDHPTGNKAA